jgi:hypothetical protein
MDNQFASVPGTEETEPTVEMLREQSEQDDAAPAAEITLDELADDSDEQDETEKPQEREPSKKSQGWIKNRIQAGVDKERARIESDVQSKIDAAVAKATEPLMQRLGTIQSKFIDQEIQDLVSSGKIPDKDTAAEYVKLKYSTAVPIQGKPPDQKQPVPPEPKQVDARTDILARQAMKLNKLGYDVMAAYNGDPDVQAKVQSGEWDMYDVADSIGAKPAPLVPQRTSNGGRVPKMSVSDLLSSERGEKVLDEFLANGGIVRGR